MSTRQTIDLGGQWECCPSEADRPPSDQAVWRPIVVPSNWHLAGLPNYSGTVWFRRRFAAAPEAGRAWLRFDGVDYFAEVWLNGAPLGRHEGYFEPFEFEVGTLLGPTNELLVRVSAPKEAPGAWPNRKRLIKGIFQHHDCRPGAWSEAYGQDEGTGGIWNRVQLAWTPEPRLAALRVDARPPSQPDGPAQLVARLETDSPIGGSARLRLTARGRTFESEPLGLLETNIWLQAGRQEHRYHLTLPEPRLWWPWDQGQPELYLLRAELTPPEGAPDALEAEFGVRELRIADDSSWWLNGRRFFPRGTNLIPTQWLASYGPEQIERDLALLVQANVNTVRIHAHVNRAELYAACDRVGLLVWQDFALQWSYDESAEFLAEACRQIAAMGRQLYNHPSIVVWCCHNEPSFNRHSLDPLLAEALGAVDRGRPIVEASDFRTHPYPGWYWSSLDEFRARPCAPFVSEFGAQALPDRPALEAMFEPAQLWPPDWEAWAYRDFQYDQTVNVADLPPDDDLDDWIRRSQAYQARLLRVAIESYRRGKYRSMSGIFQFMFVDCWDAITWSVLDHQRRPKSGYEALRRAYQPLLPSIDLRREHALPGGQIQAGFWAINDLPRAFAGLTLRFGLRDAAGYVWWDQLRPLPELAADSALPVFAIEESGFSPWLVPTSAPPGPYTIFAELLAPDASLVASNEHPFEVRPAPR